MTTRLCCAGRFLLCVRSRCLRLRLCCRFRLAGLDLGQRLTERFVFRAERVKLLAQRGELLLNLTVCNGLMHLVMAVHIQRSERDERAPAIRPIFFMSDFRST